MISAPEDYGLSREQTLAQRADPDRPAGFEHFWALLREAAGSLPDRFVGRVSGPVDRLIIRSLNDVRVVGWLHEASGAPRGAVLTTEVFDEDAAVPPETPGRDAEPDEIVDWTRRGLAVLRLKVRGLPPSTIDIEADGEQWIIHHIESREDWILRGAVLDVMTAYRCLRCHLGADLPIALHGASIAGGLAVIAAAQLSELGDAPDRLVASCPDLGDWRWRVGRYCNGPGRLINLVLDGLREEAGPVLDTIRLFDAALHAPLVRCPCLFKLAWGDDTVPAPAAAAIYNALGSQEKWRFVTTYGHYEGGIANARRHALFRRLEGPFLDPGLSPAAAMRASAERLEPGNV